MKLTKLEEYIISNMDGVIASLNELSAWMREHTGPRDGTEPMLIRCVTRLKAIGEWMEHCRSCGKFGKVQADNLCEDCAFAPDPQNGKVYTPN